MEETTSDWSALPQDLLARIGKCLRTIDNCIFDNLRFRAVCTCWRFSLPPFSPSPLTLPFPLVPGHNWDTGHFTLKESTLYHLKPLPLYQQQNHPNSGGFFLLIVGEQQHPPHQLRLITPLDRSSSSYWWDDQTTTFTYPKEINLLDFHISKICKSHSVQSFVNYEFEAERLESPWLDPDPHIGKVLFLHHNNHSHDNPSYSMLTSRQHALFFMQHGDDQWTHIRIRHNWHDYITYNGKFYLVAPDGRAMTIDSSGNLKVITPPVLDHNPDKGYQSNVLKLVIESVRGDLLFYYCYIINGDQFFFKLYRLDEEDQHMWVQMTTLDGDQLLLVGEANDGLSFSLLTRDFPALLCKGNCIYEACLYSKPDEFPHVMVSNFDHGDATHKMHGHPLWSCKDLYPCTEFTLDDCDTCDENSLRAEKNFKGFYIYE